MKIFGINISFKWIPGLGENDAIIPFNPENLNLTVEKKKPRKPKAKTKVKRKPK